MLWRVVMLGAWTDDWVRQPLTQPYCLSPEPDSGTLLSHVVAYS